MAHLPPNATRPATPTPRTQAKVEGLLRELGSKLRRGHAGDSPPDRLRSPNALPAEKARGWQSAAAAQLYLPTGIDTLDQLLGGGFPRGRLSEIAGPVSSGLTSLALALLAQTTLSGATTAVVDGSDAFDPGSAHSAGVLLDRVLWVRTDREPAPGKLRGQSRGRGGRDDRSGANISRLLLRSAERILKAHGFALVLLDLTIPNLRISPATGPRLVRAAASTGTALVIATRTRCMGTAAEIAIELTPARAHFTGTPALLEGLEIQATLVRHRSTPTPRSTTIQLYSAQTATAMTSVPAKQATVSAGKVAVSVKKATVSAGKVTVSAKKTTVSAA